MALIDTNILVYSVRKNCREYERARTFIKTLVDGSEIWNLAWQNAYEFISVITDSRQTKDNPHYIDEALDQVRGLLQSPSLQMIHPGPKHFEIFSDLAAHTPGVRGFFVHDARLVSVMIENGVREIYTADEGFRRFRDIRVINPLV